MGDDDVGKKKKKKREEDSEAVFADENFGGLTIKAGNSSDEEAEDEAEIEVVIETKKVKIPLKRPRTSIRCFSDLRGHSTRDRSRCAA